MNSFKRVRAFQTELEFGNVGFLGKGQGKNLSEQGREPITNSTHTWLRRQDLNPGHVGGRPPLRHPCSLKDFAFILSSSLKPASAAYVFNFIIKTLLLVFKRKLKLAVHKACSPFYELLLIQNCISGSWQEPITPGCGNRDCQSKTIFQFNKREKNALKCQQENTVLKVKPPDDAPRATTSISNHYNSIIIYVLFFKWREL